MTCRTPILRLRCSVDGRVLQDGRTRDMIFSVPELILRISAVCPIRAGRPDLHRYPVRGGHGA